jgi:hypothetical protein
VEIIKKKSPKASFIDFHSYGRFHSAFRPACFFQPSFENGQPLYQAWERWSFIDDSRGTNCVDGPALTPSEL